MTTAASAEQHYDADYFAWQRKIGEFSAKANRFKFAPHIAPGDRVVDFGCGGGYLLAALTCAERLGVEVNPVARTEADRQNVRTVPSSDDLPDAWADVLISNSALEHVEYPLGELRKLWRKIRPGGRIVIVVPLETLDSVYRPDDINQHLYTWSPLNLGNLLTTAGFVVDAVTPSRLMWPPKYELCYSLLGERGFLALCRLYRIVRLICAPIKGVDCHSAVIGVAHRPL